MNDDINELFRLIKLTIWPYNKRDPMSRIILPELRWFFRGFVVIRFVIVGIPRIIIILPLIILEAIIYCIVTVMETICDVLGVFGGDALPHVGFILGKPINNLDDWLISCWDHRLLSAHGCKNKEELRAKLEAERKQGGKL